MLAMAKGDVLRGGVRELVLQVLARGAYARVAERVELVRVLEEGAIVAVRVSVCAHQAAGSPSGSASRR